MTNSNPNALEYVNLYPDEVRAEVPVVEAQLQNAELEFGTQTNQEKLLQVPPWVAPSSKLKNIEIDLEDEDESDDESYNQAPQREKKPRRQRRSLASQYAELDENDKQTFVFNKVYNVLKKLYLDKENMTTLLYSLGDAIASEVYPPAPQRKNRYTTAKVDPQTIVEYIEQLSDDDRAELLAQITATVQM